jgi:hypothetical protein
VCFGVEDAADRQKGEKVAGVLEDARCEAERCVAAPAVYCQGSR